MANLRNFLITFCHSLWRKRVLASTAALFLFSAGASWAHDPGLSMATARLGEGRLTIHLAMARADAEQILSPESNRLGQLGAIEFQKALPELQRQTAGSFEIRSHEKLLMPESATLQRDDKNGILFDLNYSGVSIGPLSIRSAWLGRLARGHRQYFSVQDAAGHLFSEKMLDASQDTISLTIEVSAPKMAVRHSFREFLTLGLEHIATGYDHQLFLLGLLLVGGSLRSALKIITSFTVAHSITLALTALNAIHLSPSLVEPLIAASIVFVGVENLLRRNLDNRWRLTFCFGLIHGCGFAAALQDLGVGANGSPILVPLASFNLGVELGQLAIASLVLPVIWKCQTSPNFVRCWLPASSALIVLAGGYWLAQRTLL